MKDTYKKKKHHCENNTFITSLKIQNLVPIRGLQTFVDAKDTHYIPNIIKLYTYRIGTYHHHPPILSPHRYQYTPPPPHWEKFARPLLKDCGRRF